MGRLVLVIIWLKNPATLLDANEALIKVRTSRHLPIHTLRNPIITSVSCHAEQEAGGVGVQVEVTIGAGSSKISDGFTRRRPGKGRPGRGSTRLDDSLNIGSPTCS